GLRLLDTDLSTAVTTAAGAAAVLALPVTTVLAVLTASAVGADVLRLITLLRRVGIVGGLRLGLGVGGLIRRARARGDVATSDVDGHVRAHGVLVTHRERSGLLIGR